MAEKSKPKDGYSNESKLKKKENCLQYMQNDTLQNMSAV